MNCHQRDSHPFPLLKCPSRAYLLDRQTAEAYYSGLRIVYLPCPSPLKMQMQGVLEWLAKGQKVDDHHSVGQRVVRLLQVKAIAFHPPRGLELPLGGQDEYQMCQFCRGEQVRKRR